MKKFEMMNWPTRIFMGRTLYRIVAIRSFGDVSVGQIGGWIEREDNLKHAGDCWIADDAVVCGSATVSGNAVVEHEAKVFGYALVTDNSHVLGRAEVSGNVIIGGNAMVADDVTIYDKALVTDDAVVCGNATVTGNAVVGESAVISGSEVRSGHDVDLGEDAVEDQHLYTVDEVLDAMRNRMGWAIGQSATKDIKQYLELKDDPDYQTFLKLKAMYDR